MRFNIFHDKGGRISGFVIPDSYSKIHSLRVMSDGRSLGVFPTNEFNEAFFRTGQHESGLVNFLITETMVPGLSSLHDLTLLEDESGFLLYRRLQPDMLTKKYLRLETQLFPLWRLDNAFQHRFQQFYHRIEALGATMTGPLFNLTQSSIYLSGRLQLKNYGSFVDKGFELLILLRDPYDELAERLLVLNQVQRTGQSPLDERELINMRKAIEFAGGLPLNDAHGVKRAFARMPIDVAVTMANPVVRQFTTSTLDEQASSTGVATTLDILANAALVGLRAEPEQFVCAVEELLGVDVSDDNLMPVFPPVAALSAALRDTGYCEGFLEKDLELYHAVLQAYSAVMDNRS